MFLYLVRHGEAKNKNEDPLQGLTDKGIRDVNKTARYLAEQRVKVTRIFHSGKLRAFQTAQIIADAMGTDYPITETDGLAPTDDPGIWYERICEMNCDTLLVGHLPYLNILFALLLSGTQGNGLVGFETGETACFERAQDCRWELKWKTSPEMIK
ncbi:MAG: phosphohistidine phosphatase SixA [Nitrospirae bacterium]|nr:phosphohistidine phosphatase SixA [Nitrospirota bacterium]